MKPKTIARLWKCLVTAALFLSVNVAAQDGYVYSGKKSSDNFSSRSQDTNDKQALITVLKDLNRQRGMYFLYAEESMSRKLVNPVRNIEGDIEKILDDVLRNTGLKHRKISENTFVILNAGDRGKNHGDYIKADLSDTEQPLNYKPFEKITGRITDNEGFPLVGVSVSVKNSNKGTTTNSRGEFSLEANKGDILVVSYIGYAPQEHTVGDNPVIMVSLTLINKQMNEVVVTALGIRKESKRLGYSVTKVGGEEFTKAREINVGNALVGKIAGVNSSAPLTGPGGSSRVTIRGNSSFGDNQPLYVVNGVPINNENLGSAGKWGGSDFGDGVSSLNPDDIEEITVLKGGAAAALYGQRGKNGVILITTKSGKGKKALGIELNSNIMIDRVNDFRDFQDQYGQGFQGAKPANQAAALNSGLYSWGAKLDGSSVTLFDGQQHPYSAVGKDNLHEFYGTGSTFTNTIAITAGTDAASFRMSFGDLRNSSVYPNSKYNRNNVNVDLGYKLSEKLSGSANISYIKEVGKNRANLSDAPGNGNFAILFLPPNVKASYLSPGYDQNGMETQFNDNAYNTNPYFAAAKFQNNTSRDRILGVASLRYNFLKWLYVQGRVGNDFFSFDATSITPTGTAYKPTGTINLVRSYDYNEFNADILVGLNRNITTDLTIGVTAGANVMKMQGKVLDVSADGLAFPFLYNPGAASSRNANLHNPRKRVHSVYGAVELAWRNTVFLNLTDRNDWSSALPTGKNSYNYPSFNLAYIFTEQLKTSWLSYGKARIGYAVVGADAPIFSTLLYYNTNGAINGNLIGNLDNQIPNKNLEPLKVTEFEVGAEMKFLKSRLFADVAWYDKQTLNEVVSVTVSTTSGYTTALVNVGKLANKGIELLVGGTPVKTNNFSWTSSINFANNKNKVVSLAEGQSSMQVLNGESRTERGFIQHIAGMPFAQVMVFDVKRDVKGVPILGPNGLQANDVLTPMGTSVHPTTGGFNNDLNYKNFGLSFLIDYKFGAVIYSGTNATALQRGLHKETLNGRETGIVVTGVNDMGAPVTQTVAAQNYYNELYRISALQVYDADFIKFRSLSLSYNIPARILKNKIAGMSLSLVGRNLFYIKKSIPNIDPEANYSNSNAQGLEYAGLPSVRSFGFNLNVKF